MNPLPNSLEKYNLVLIMLDSLAYSSAEAAKLTVLSQLGPLRAAQAWAPYTPGAHSAAFLGHWPTCREAPLSPFYCESTRQPFRVLTGPARDAGRGCGLLLEGNNIIEGFRRRGMFVHGTGGVSQFSTGSFLRTAFPWSRFDYWGPDMDEEPMSERAPETFPLNHTEEIVDVLEGQEHWVLFQNDPEPHYPYDTGNGFPAEVDSNPNLLRDLKSVLNLRCLTAPQETVEGVLPHAETFRRMQVEGLEIVDRKLGELFKGLRRVSSRPIFVMVCGDHGECFGEMGPEGKPLFGHLHASAPEVMTVPLWVGVL